MGILTCMHGACIFPNTRLTHHISMKVSNLPDHIEFSQQTHNRPSILPTARLAIVSLRFLRILQSYQSHHHVSTSGPIGMNMSPRMNTGINKLSCHPSCAFLSFLNAKSFIKSNQPLCEPIQQNSSLNHATYSSSTNRSFMP